MAKSKKKSYGSQVLAVAPAFAVKSLLGDLPRGGIEKAVELKVSGSKGSSLKALSQGLKGRGAGRALGGALGIASAPVFLGGLKLLNSKNKSDQAKGLLMLGASAAGYQSVKGLTEGFREARAANLSKSKSITEGLKLGLIRSGYKTPAALALGLSVAAGRKKSKDKKNASKFLAPALAGAAIGALSRGGEGVAKDILAKKGIKASLKGKMPRLLGGAAGGLLGGAVLGGVVDSAMKSLEKKSSVQELEKNADVATASLVKMLELAGIHGATKAAFGYGKEGRLFGRTRLGKYTQRKAEEAKAKQLAIGIREGVSGRRTQGFRAGLVGNLSVPIPGLGFGPELKIQRSLGIDIGNMLRKLPPSVRAKYLDSAKAFVERNPAMRTTKAGEPVAVFNQLPDAVDMVLGRKSLPGSKLQNMLLYGGRGGLKTDLKAGALDKASPIKDTLPNLLTIGGGAAAVAASGGLGLAGIPLGALGAHGALSGSKNIVAKLPAIRRQGLAQGAKGIREAFLPRLGTTKASRRADLLMDYGISPGARDFGRIVGGASRGLLQEGRRQIRRVANQKFINRAAAKGYGTPLKDIATPAILTGSGVAGLDAIFRGNKS